MSATGVYRQRPFVPFIPPRRAPLGGAAGSPLVAGTLTRGTITATQIAVTGTAASGGTAPYTYQWHRSTAQGFTPSGGTALAGQTGQNLADTTPAATTVYYYRRVDTDNAAASATTGEAAAALHAGAAVAHGVVGDSIMALTPSGGARNPGQALAAHLAAIAGVRDATVANRAIAGTATADWLPADPSGNLTAAKAAFAAAGATHVHLLLGANDCRLGVGAATYGANLASIAGDLVAAGYTCLLHMTGWIKPGASGMWGPTDSTLLAQYKDQLDALVNGTTILAGDRVLWGMMTDYEGTLTVDGVHPSVAGVETLGEALAKATATALGWIATGTVAGVRRLGMTGGIAG